MSDKVKYRWWTEDEVTAAGLEEPVRSWVQATVTAEQQVLDLQLRAIRNRAAWKDERTACLLERAIALLRVDAPERKEKP